MASGLLKALRSTHHTRMIPVLLISGRAIHEQRIEGYKEGADGYLPNPTRNMSCERVSLNAAVRAPPRRSRPKRGNRANRQQALAERAALLESITEQLRQADQRKNEFLAILAHELRQPPRPGCATACTSSS